MKRTTTRRNLFALTALISAPLGIFLVVISADAWSYEAWKAGADSVSAGILAFGIVLIGVAVTLVAAMITSALKGSGSQALAASEK